MNEESARQGARRGLTIKVTLVAAVSLLSGLLIAGYGWSAVGAWQRLQQTRDSREFDKGANMFVAGLFQVLLERLYTNNGLQSEAAATPALLSQIEASRKAARELFQPGLAELKSRDFPLKQDLLLSLDSTAAKADQYRAMADQALVLPRDRRDETLLKTFIPTITASVDASLNVWFSALYRAAATDPALERLATVKEIGWRMRDFAGRERSSVSQAIASGQPFSAATLAASAGFRARVEVLWQQLENLTSEPGTFPAIRNAMAAAKEQYFGAFLKLNDDLRKLDEDGGKYGITASDYVTKTSPQIDTLLKVMYAAGEASEAHTAAAASEAVTGLAVTAGFAILGLVVAIGSVVMVIRRVVRPLTAMTLAMTRLADNQTSIEIPGVGRADEIGEMADAVEVFRQGAIENGRLVALNTREQANKDRQKAVMDQYTQDFGTTVAGVMVSLGKSASDMSKAATDMAEAATQTRESSISAVEGANSSSRDLNSVAVAAEQMAASINEISNQVAHVTAAVTKAVDRATVTDAKVAGLAQAADRIGDVVRIITDIAGQTNLLALNATIEAARAGDAGKGFAVVAGEVKALANQTAKATEQIGAQIVAIRGATSEAVDAVREVGEAIGQVESVAAAIAAAVEQQAAATLEISGSVQTVTMAIAGAARSMQEVLTIAERTDTTSHTVLAAAGTVGQTADTLRVEVNDFLSAMAGANANAGDRRAYERIPAGDARASLLIPGRDEISSKIRDISRGGIALICDAVSPSGATVKVGLPAGGTVSGRIVRSEGGTLSIAFNQDAATAAQVDKALDSIRQSGRSRAA